MQYTKPMIELVYEIRKAVPSNLKPGIKLANPDLFNELIEHYHSATSRTVTKALIKELLSQAGVAWSQNLEQKKALEAPLLTKMYRGVVSLEEGPSRSEEYSLQQKKRIYRGQVIA